MTTCRELLEFILDYLAGELPEAEHRQFELHLSVCPSCVTYVRSYEKTVRLGKDAWGEAADPALPDLPEELVRAVQSARRTRG